jgi:hypothetical protein
MIVYEVFGLLDQCMTLRCYLSETCLDYKHSLTVFKTSNKMHKQDACTDRVSESHHTCMIWKTQDIMTDGFGSWDKFGRCVTVTRGIGPGSQLENEKS